MHKAEYVCGKIAAVREPAHIPSKRTMNGPPWTNGNRPRAEGPVHPGPNRTTKRAACQLSRFRDLTLALDTIFRASHLLQLRLADVQNSAGEVRGDLAIQ